MTGLGEVADQWVQQFFDHDPDGMRTSWPAFKNAMKSHFGDPDFQSNARSELLSLKQFQCKTIQEYITRYETLCAQGACVRTCSED